MFPRRVAILTLVLLWACDDLDDFRTDDSSVFQGEVIGSDSDSDVTSFIRQGFESHTQMELTFDPDLAAGGGGVAAPGAMPAAGTIRTYRCPPERSFCPEDERVAGQFDTADLEPIASLNHDALSEYDFPGAGRIRNYMLGARFRSGAGADTVARNAMVFVSLMDNRALEVRVVAASELDDEGEELHPALFGVFLLERRAL